MITAGPAANHLPGRVGNFGGRSSLLASRGSDRQGSTHCGRIWDEDASLNEEDSESGRPPPLPFPRLTVPCTDMNAHIISPGSRWGPVQVDDPATLAIKPQRIPTPTWSPRRSTIGTFQSTMPGPSSPIGTRIIIATFVMMLASGNQILAAMLLILAAPSRSGGRTRPGSRGTRRWPGGSVRVCWFSNLRVSELPFLVLRLCVVRHGQVLLWRRPGAVAATCGRLSPAIITTHPTTCEALPSCSMCRVWGPTRQLPAAGERLPSHGFRRT
jgi:hypothetical protein